LEQTTLNYLKLHVAYSVCDKNVARRLLFVTSIRVDLFSRQLKQVRLYGPST